MIEPWKLLEAEYIVDNKWIRFSSRKFQLPNGVTIPDYYIVEKPDIVIVVPLTYDGQTLIMREFERGVMEVGFKFPAGRVKKDESPIDAAQREFMEETGINIDKIIAIGTLDADPGWLTTKVHIFAAEISTKDTQASNDPEELFEMEWTDFKSFGKMISCGEVHNIFVVAAYHLAEKYLETSER